MTKPDDISQEAMALRSLIIQFVHDCIKDGMIEADFATAKIDEMCTRAIMKAQQHERNACAEAGAHAAEQFVRYKIGNAWSDECGNAVEAAIRSRNP